MITCHVIYVYLLNKYITNIYVTCDFLIFRLNTPYDALSRVVLTQGYDVTSDRYVVFSRHDAML